MPARGDGMSDRCLAGRYLAAVLQAGRWLHGDEGNVYQAGRVG